MRPSAADPAARLRVAGGACLIAAPLAFLAGTLIHPGLRRDSSEQLELIAAHSDAWYVTHLLGLTFVVLMLPAVLALVRLLRERQPLLGHLGGALALAGFVGWAGVVAIYGWVLREMAAAGDRAEMNALLEEMTENPSAVIPTRGLSFLAVVGMIVLAVGLVRARVSPMWAGPAAAAGFVQFAVGASSAAMPLMIAGTALMTVGLGALGLAVIRTPERRAA